MTTPASPLQFPELIDALDLGVLSEVNRSRLKGLGAKLRAQYARNDKAAIKGQKRHETIVIFVGVFGTLAVLLGLVELAHKKIPAPADLVTTGIAAAAVILGLRAALHHSWLLMRHRAECYQLLMWSVLTSPGLWGSSEEEASAVLASAESRLAHLEHISYRSLETWLDDDEAPVGLPSGGRAPPPRLISLYCDVRLDGQKDYFIRRSRVNRRLDRWTRLVAPVAFGLSVVAVLWHFLRDVILRTDSQGLLGTDSEGGLGFALLLAAVGIPVLAGAFRVIRGALEPARNFTRYRGKHKVLEKLARRIRQSDQGAPSVFTDLAQGEQILEAEHREWLRLMMEAEWIG